MIQGANPYRDGSLLYDNLGNKYEAGVVTLANDQNPQRISREIIADYPVKSSVNFPNIDNRAKYITSLNIQISAQDVSQKEIQLK